MVQERKIAKINYMNKKSLIYEIASILMTFYSYGEIEEYIIIDNISKALTMYPNDIENNVIRCTIDNLLKEVENALVNSERYYIIINDFDLSLDYIKEKLLPLVKETGHIVINNIVEEDLHDEKASLYIGEEFLNSISSEEEWNEIRNDMEAVIKDELDKARNKSINKDDNLTEIDKVKELLNNILIDNDIDIELEEDNKANYINELFNEDFIKESYSHKANNSEIKIALTEDNEILISDLEEAITINKDQWKFLLTTLKQLTNIR